MSVRVTNKVVRQLIGQHISKSINKKHIVDMLVGSLDGTSMEAFVSLCMMTDEYVPLKKGDYVEIITSSVSSRGNADNLKDHHMLKLNEHGETVRCGIVVDSGNYGEDFNPYHYQMKVDMFDLDDDNNVCTVQDTHYTHELTISYDNHEKWYSMYEKSKHL
jgi:hypothetical protein|tara:strand:+ start:904 stop:1386 length:483 start_codon:yes stop_codon:yes gene_type:complete